MIIDRDAIICILGDDEVIRVLLDRHDLSEDAVATVDVVDTRVFDT